MGFASLRKIQPSAGQWLGIIGISLLFAALRWNSFNAPLTPDEGEYAYAAQSLERGIAPYDHAFIQKPPMIIYSYAVADLLWPHLFWAPRLLAGLFVALATVLLGWIARREFGGGFAWPTLWLVTPMILLPGIDQFEANTEMFLLLPLLATIAIYVYSRHQGHKPRFCFAAAFLGITALLYKYTVLPLLLFLWVNWLIEVYRLKGAASLWQCLASSFWGALLAATTILGYFLAHDGGATLWECTVRFNRYYVETGTFGSVGLWFNLKLFWAKWWILFIIPCAALVKPKPRLGFWFGMLIGAWLCSCGSWYRQYYILAMPFWALLTAVGISSLASPIAQYLARPQKWIEGALLFVIVLIVLMPDLAWLTYTPEEFVAENLFETGPFLVARPAAARVAELSSPDQYVCVIGSDPEILSYARRISPTRFITAYQLVFRTPVKRLYQQQAIRDLQQHPPSLVLTTRWLSVESPPSEFMVFVKNLLAHDYQRLGGYIIKDRKMYWSESLTDQEAAHSILTLFKRKDSLDANATLEK